MRKLSIVLLLALAVTANAGSIGRSSGGSSFRSTQSFSRPSPSPSFTPSPSVAPSRQGGIGGTTGSIGVRKPEITNQARPVTPPSYSSPQVPRYTAPNAPTYSYPSAPVQAAPSGGSTFMHSLGGSFAGSMLGNMMFGNHGHSGGGTTVVNNGGGGSGYVSGGSPAAVGTDGTVYQQQPVMVAPPKSYGLWEFIKDVFLFALLLVTLVGFAWLLYRGYKMIRDYVKKEKENKVVNTTHFDAIERFYAVQEAFASADKAALENLLSAGMYAETTRGLEPTKTSLSNVTYTELASSQKYERSIHYTFKDTSENLVVELNQVWHFALSGVAKSTWVLEGIENL